MRKILFTYPLLVFLFIGLSTGILQAQEKIGSNIYGVLPNDEFGTVTTLNSDGNIFAASSQFGLTSSGVEGGYVGVFQWNGTDWELMGNYIEGDYHGSNFGVSLDLNDAGDRLVIGAPTADVDGVIESGYMEVYEFKNGDWVRMIRIAATEPYIYLGWHVSISGNGDQFAYSQRFSPIVEMVKVYEYDGEFWNLKGDVFVGDGESISFGESFDMDYSGNRIAISSSSFSETLIRNGRIQVFDFTGSNWGQVGGDVFGTTDSGYLGLSLALDDDGTTFVAAAPFSDANGEETGEVKVYDLIGGEWLQRGETIYGTEELAGLGQRLDLSGDGDSFVVCSPWSTYLAYRAGNLKYFQWNGNEWAENGHTLYGTEDFQSYGVFPGINHDGSRISGGTGRYNSYRGVAQVFDMTMLEIESVSQTQDGLVLKTNPVQNVMELYNGQHYSIESIELYDTMLRRVKSFEPRAGDVLQFNVQAIAQGTYFLVVEYEGTTQVIKLLKI